MVTTPELATEVSAYRPLLRALAAATPSAASNVSDAAAALLAAGEAPARVYRVVVRALLARAVDPSAAATTPALPDDLLALNAALFLAEALPADERAPFLAGALGRAAAAIPAVARAPLALPHPHPASTPPSRATSPLATSSAASHTDAPPAPDVPAEPHAQDLRAGLLAGDGAGAEWALAALLAGPDGATLPDPRVRRAAYTILFAFAAGAPLSIADHPARQPLLLAQHAAEMAELLPPSLTLLALRPAVWALAAHHSTHHAPSHPATGRAARSRPAASAKAPDTLTAVLDCAQRVNRRPARPGETLQWAQALRTGDLSRVVDEALASGLNLSAVLDAAILATLLIPVPASASAAEPAPPVLAALLNLHAARRALALSDAFAPVFAAALAAALAALRRVVAAIPATPQTARNHARALLRALPTQPASPLADTVEVARVVALAHAAAAAGQSDRAAAAPAILAAEAVLAEIDEASDRSLEYSQLLLSAASAWQPPSASAHPGHAG